MASVTRYFFTYQPSIGADVIANIFFGAITAIHAYKFVKTYKTTRVKILIVLTIASIIEVLAYALRVPASRDDPKGFLQAFAPMFLVLAPVILTTVIYTIFHKISTAVAPQSGLYKSSLMLKVFSGMDIICQIAISVGAMMASKAPVYFIGKGILLAGIAVHISTMLAFVSTVVVWQRRVHGKWTSDLDNYTKSTEKDLLAVYIATGLIVVRSLFRFIEFASGPNGSFQDDETLFYLYEFVPMAATFVVCCRWYNSKTLQVSALPGDQMLEEVFSHAT